MKYTDIAIAIIESGIALAVVEYWVLYVWRLHKRASAKDRQMGKI